MEKWIGKIEIVLNLYLLLGKVKNRVGDALRHNSDAFGFHMLVGANLTCFRFYAQGSKLSTTCNQVQESLNPIATN